jgi:hypothetical protein
VEQDCKEYPEIPREDGTSEHLEEFQLKKIKSECQMPHYNGWICRNRKHVPHEIQISVPV